MASARGHTVDIARNRVLIFESILEFYLANILMAQRNIVDIRDQPAALEYELDGVQSHTLDFISMDFRSHEIGYMVKPSQMLERDETIAKRVALKRRHVPRLLTDILVVTEKTVVPRQGAKCN